MLIGTKNQFRHINYKTWIRFTNIIDILGNFYVKKG